MAPDLFPRTTALGRRNCDCTSPVDALARRIHEHWPGVGGKPAWVLMNIRAACDTDISGHPPFLAGLVAYCHNTIRAVVIGEKYGTALDVVVVDHRVARAACTVVSGG